jgi:putative sterol carrier protein
MNPLAFAPRRAAATIRQALAEAPVQLAGGVSRAIETAPPARLEQLMRTPIRRVVLDGIFWQMPQNVDAGRASRLSSSIRWRTTGRGDGSADVYDLVFRNGQCYTHRGGADSPPLVTITVDGAEFLRLASGNSDPMRAYFKGQVGVAGDITVAAKLVSLLLMPAETGD